MIITTDIPHEILKEFQLDFERISTHIIEKLKEYIHVGGKKGGIVGLSGGIDSTVTTILLSKATQNYKILLMPSESTPKKDMEDALRVIKMIGAEDKYEVIEIDDIVNLISRKVKTQNKVNIGNIKARTRMILLYSIAHDLDYLVVGSGDKSELMIGYFTKYGDGGVDILPIGDLYKTQVRLLGKYLGVPDDIVRKPSSPALWQGHKAEDELGMSYELIDAILLLRYEKGYPIQDVAKILGISEHVITKVEYMVKSSEHKRNPPRIIKIK